MHIFSLPWKIVRYLGCTRPGKMDATTDVNLRLLIPRNYRILEKAGNERAGFAKGIRV